MDYEGLIIRDIVFVHNLNKPRLIRWHSRRHAHVEHEFHYFLGGSGRFENGSITHAIRAGSLHLSPPGLVHEIHPEDPADDPLSYYAVLFEARPDLDIAEVLRDENFLAAFPTRLGNSRRILFEDLKNRYAHPDRNRSNAARHQLASFIFDLNAGFVEERRAPMDRSEYSVHLERALSAFQRGIAEALRLPDVASTVGVTPEHLIRLFTGRFGITPMHYYRRLKLEAAGSMLLNSRLSVKEIAWELGFANPFHFSRSFKEFAGVSPREYRSDYYRSNPVKYSIRVV